jgi:hypothetical protein
MAVGEQSVMADAVQALGQYERQKAANELVGWHSQRKAYTSRTFRIPSGEFVQRVKV